MAGGLALGVTPVASAATSVSASTNVSNRPDGGHGTPSVWADDTFTRTLTVTLDSTAADCGSTTPPGDSCYAVQLSDSGKFTTRPGAGAPNANNPSVGAGLSIAAPAVTGTFSGGYTQHVFSNTAPDASLVPATENDQGSTTGPGFHSTEAWFKQAFPSTAAFGTTQDGDYSWTYSTGCETWTDSSANNDGNSVGDGNITGKTCATVPPPSTVVIGPGEVSSFLTHSVTCLDNSGFRWVAGNPLQEWACGAAGGQDQQFELFTKDSVTQLRALAPAGKPQGPWCVTAPAGTGRLTIQPCDSANASQHVAKQGSKYVFTGDAGDVMDIRGASSANGTAVIAYPPNGGKNQQWSLP